ncbi:unnamed protein product [Caenorhabditis sp. 36 PRJEB53466]|nr:unnamed protein product [Caenorhabditis sp. 36 PRJEB53466]
MRLHSFLVTTFLLLGAASGAVLRPKGPSCPQGDGLYAVGCSSKYLQCINNMEHEQSCPDGLFFDNLLSRCERRASNHLCNSENRKTLNVRQKAVEISCKGRAGGDYPIDRFICNENYYQCANDRFFMRKCPYNQFFSPVLKRCDYRTNCLGSDGIKLHPAAAYASPTYDHDNYEVTTEEIENVPAQIDCNNYHRDAIIADWEQPCSRHFFQCSNGKLLKKSCPQGLFFVLEQNICDYPRSVKACPEYDGSETLYEPAQPVDTEYSVYAPTAPSTTPSYAPPQTTTTTRPPYVPPATTKTPVYAPQPTTTTTTTPSYVPSSAPVAPVYVPPPAAPPVPYEDTVKYDCVNKTDGIHEIAPCHHSFLVCTYGKARVVECNHKLVFDVRVGACEFVDACKGPRKQEDVPPLYNHGGVYDEKPVEKKVDFDCSDKADGDYFREACTNEYFQCRDRRAFARHCPANLVYNKALQTCDYIQHCEKNYMEPTVLYTTEQPYHNGNNGYTTQPPVSTVYTQPPATTAYTKPSHPVYTTAAPTVRYEQPTTTQGYTASAPYNTPAVDDFSCINREEGDHASGICQNIFYSCSNNEPVAKRCPGNLVYNPYNGQCDYKENVADCRGKDYSGAPPTVPYSNGYTTKTTQGYVTVPPVTKTYTAVETTYQPTQPAKYYAYCELLADGKYGEECERFFYECVDFATTKVICPAGLFYDRKHKKCDWRENIEECPGYQPTATTPAQEQPATSGYGQTSRTYPNIDYTTPVPGPVDTTPIAEAFSCYGRVDGIYALPYCSKDYVQCINGRTLLSSCATGLYYSEKSGLCDYKENVPICKNRQGADVISENACAGRADGYYSAGCSSHYFSCIGEKTRKMVCPNKLKFSESRAHCDYPTDVKECSISVQPGNAPPAVPSEFCTVRPNGLHAFKPCSPHYVVCENNIAIAGTCAAPLVFNEVNQLCDYKNNNKECGNDYVPTTVQSEYYGQTTSGQTYQKPTTRAYEQPTTTTTSAKPYQQPTTTTKVYEQPTTTTTTAYEQPTTTTKAYEQPTTTTKAYEQPTTTTTRAYEQPTTTTKVYEHPTTTTTTSKPYEQPTTITTTTEAPTTPAQDVYVPTSTTSRPHDVPTTTTIGYSKYETTTTAPAYAAPITVPAAPSSY